MKNLLAISIISLLFFSCQEEVFLELKNFQKTPVIEAIWTDDIGLNQVEVFYSRDYYSEETYELVNHAEVFILNLNTDERISFLYHEKSERYLPLNNAKGKFGELYELHVVFDGEEYISKGELLEPPVLDSLTYTFREKRIFREEGYYLRLYGSIPFTENNNYRIRIIKNDTLLNRPSDYLLFDDSFGTSILDRGFELNGFAFNKGDNVSLELFRLNQDAYNYLSQLVNLLFNDGGLFSPPPQNPVSNIFSQDRKNEVLGYFLVSPYLSVTVDIEVDDD